MCNFTYFIKLKGVVTHFQDILNMLKCHKREVEKMLQQEILWLPINDAYDIIQKQIYNSIQYQFIQKRDILAFEEFFLKLNSI